MLIRLMGLMGIVLAGTAELAAEPFVEQRAGAHAARLVQGVGGEDEIVPEVVLKDAETDWHDFRHWFLAERRHLEIMAVGLGISVVIGVGLGWLLHWLLRLRAPARAGFKMRLAQALAGPIILLLTMTAMFMCMVPVLNSLPHAYPHDVRIFMALAMMVGAWAGFHVVELFAGTMSAIARRDTNRLNRLMVEIVRKSLKIIIVVMVILFIAQSIFNINISALLAGAGVIGLAVAFAAKDVLANFFGTIVIAIDQPFQEGDRIQIGEGNGIVEEVGMRSTRILTADESVYAVPNSQFTDQSVVNISRAGVLKYVFDVTMVYATTPEQMQTAMDILHGIVDHFHGADLPRYVPRVFFNELADWSMNIRVIMWLKTADFKQEEEWKTQINLAIIRQFGAAKLNMAFPTTTNLISGATPTAPIAIQWSAASPPASKS